MSVDHIIYLVLGMAVGWMLGVVITSKFGKNSNSKEKTLLAAVSTGIMSINEARSSMDPPLEKPVLPVNPTIDEVKSLFGRLSNYEQCLFARSLAHQIYYKKAGVWVCALCGEKADAEHSKKYS